MLSAGALRGPQLVTLDGEGTLVGASSGVAANFGVILLGKYPPAF